MTADVLEINGEGTRYKLGAIHEPTPAAPDLATFATTTIPRPPGQVPLIHPATGWPMADNDTIGDCTVAAAVHVDQAGAIIASRDWTYCGDGVVRDTYFGLSGGQDTGLMLSQVLQPWHAGTFLGAPKNGGYASVHPQNTTQMKQSIWIFGNAYVAVNLPYTAQQQFRPDGSGVWELTHTDEDYNIEGGHCIVGVAFGKDGIYMITWGSVVLATWEWWFTYGTQAYAVVPPAYVERGGNGRGYNLHTLDTWLPKV